MSILNKLKMAAISTVIAVTTIPTVASAQPHYERYVIYYSDATYTEEVGEFTSYCAGEPVVVGHTSPYWIVVESRLCEYDPDPYYPWP